MLRLAYGLLPILRHDKLYVVAVDLLNAALALVAKPLFRLLLLAIARHAESRMLHGSVWRLLSADAFVVYHTSGHAGEVDS